MPSSTFKESASQATVTFTLMAGFTLTTLATVATALTGAELVFSMGGSFFTTAGALIGITVAGMTLGVNATNKGLTCLISKFLIKEQEND